MNKSTIAVASVCAMTIFSINIFPNDRSIAQIKQINLSGDWNTKNIPEITNFTYSNQGCTAGFDGEVIVTVDGKKPKKSNQIKLRQEGSKLIFPTVTNTSISITNTTSFKINKSGFVSGNKVQIESIATPDQGGTIRFVSTGTISDDGNTIKGKTICTYSKGQATQYDFTWQRISSSTSALEKYEVRLRLFIPSPALKVTAQDDACRYFNNAFCVFGGDNRRFSYNAPSHRYIANATVTTDSKSASPLIGKPFRDFCPTKRYLASQSSNMKGEPSWWLALKPGAKPIETKKLELISDVDKVNSVSAALIPGKTDTVKVSFKVHGSNPLVFVAPGFDADINVFIQNQLGKKPLVRVEGTHDGFPAYEIYVNQQLVYGYDPEKSGADPSNLFPPSDITISKPWTQWNPINNKYSEQKLPSCENHSNFSGFGGGSSGGGGAGGKY